jgi:hypothetical protein
MLNAMRKIRIGVWTVPVALLGICFLAYGLLLPGLGFYQDDWSLAWFSHAFGPKVFIPFFAHERPFYAYIHILTTSLVGDSAIRWQVAALICRWLSAVAVWWTMRLLWPDRSRQAVWIALLSAIYPGFKQQYLAIAQTQNFIIMTSAIFSLGVMIYGIRNPRWKLPAMVISLLCSTFSLFSIEYFFGIELLRPAILWLVMGERHPSIRERIRRTLAHWLPFLTVLGVFVYWRLFIFRFPTYRPKLTGSLLSDPYTTIIQLGQTILQDLFEVTFFAWAQTLDFIKTIQPGIFAFLLYWGVIGVITALVSLFLLKFHSHQASDTDEAEPGSWGKKAIFLGIYGLIAAGLPFWLTELPIGLEIPYDRFTFGFILTVSILTVGLIDLLIRTNQQKAILLGILVGLSVSLHLHVAERFRDVHYVQEVFFRQLVWRAPGLKPNTLLLTDVFPVPYSGASSLAIPLNWIYTPDPEYPNMAFQMFYIPEKLGGPLPDLKKGLPVRVGYRNLTFRGSTSSALVVSFDPPGCLQVLDPQNHIDLPHLTGPVAEAVPISNLNQILASGDLSSQRIEEIFGNKPEQADWCYYFEKADLARQTGDWNSVVQLGNLAFKEGLSPAYKQEMEYLPFIEGYARLGNWEQAYNLTKKTIDPIPNMNLTLCQTWKRIYQNTTSSTERERIQASLDKLLNCSSP